ncbi:MAG: hypothetical protein FJ295_19530 [Planctomycetes bacterium]|nr:hypothetical protein [Planctomycetota bacterium]
MLKRVVAFAVCLMIGLTSVVVAQEGQRKGPGGGQGGPGGGRGRGGFGGGFGGGGFGMGRGGNSLMIMAMEEVQKEVGVTDEQKKEITELLDKNRPQFGGGRGRGGAGAGGGAGGAGGDVDLEKLREEAMKRAQEMEKNVSEGLAKILKPEQMERVQQLRIQRENAAALSRAEVAEKLGITAEQKEKITKIQADARSALAGGGANFFEMSDEERQQAMAKMREQQRKTETDVLGVLTDAQKDQFAQMKGKEFKFPEPSRGGGFGGGGGGGERKRPEKKNKA